VGENVDGLSQPSTLHRCARGCFVVGVAVVGSLACLLALPLLQALTAAPLADLMVTAVDTVALPPPPPPEAEPEPDEPETPPPPALAEEAPPLDLSLLELALQPGLSGLDGAGDFALGIHVTAAAAADGADELFALADLDQKPRALFQQQPQLGVALKKKMPATVMVVFTVDANGRVEDPRVQSASDPAFESPVLAAIRQWRFEPGRRGGQPVRFRMRQPFTFQ